MRLVLLGRSVQDSLQRGTHILLSGPACRSPSGEVYCFVTCQSQ